MTTTPLAEWIQELNDDYLADWANRGLLRRGRRLAEQLDNALCDVDDTGCHAAFDGQQQRLDAPGFDHLHCSCPAAGACHHLIAFLLRLQQHESLQFSADTSDPDAPAPWLCEDFAPLSKQLGPAHVKRAHRLLLQGAEVRLDEQRGSLIADVTEATRHTVRIPRSAGLQAATCTCNAERCVHRALAVLFARQQAQLDDPWDTSQQALSDSQHEALDHIHHWLRECLAQGTTGTARNLSERGQALATVARQADLPLLSSQIAALAQLQEAEITGQTFVQIAQFRTQMAQLWLRLRALQTTPLPRPLTQLAGVHQRDYRPVQNLRLIGIGAERWHSQTDYLGLSIYFYAPEQHAWYRHSQTRSAIQAASSRWSPEQCWKQEQWADAMPFKDLPGRELQLLTGWCSSDGQLSGRAGTRVSPADASSCDPNRLPIDRDFAALTQRYGQALQVDLASPPPYLPVLIEVAVADEPVFATLDQRWTQAVRDAHGHTLQLTVAVSDQIKNKVVNTLNRWWRGGKRWRWVFGHIALHQPGLSLYPISLCFHGETRWRHPTLT